MKKQIKNQFFKSVLLLLSVILLIAGATVSILAANTETRTLHLTIDQHVESCIIEIENTNTRQWELYKTVTQSESVNIPYNANVKLTINPVTGKWPTWTIEGNSSGIEGDTTIRWIPFKADASVSIQCEERVYKLYPLEYDGTKNDLSYKEVAGSTLTVNQIENGLITYQFGAQPLTELPVVEKNDFVFKGWNIKLGEDPGSITKVPLVDGKYCIPDNLTISKYFDTEGGIIYVYPEMEAKKYPVYRQDLVFDNTAPNNHGYYLFGPIQQEEKATISIYAVNEANKDYWEDDRILGTFKTYKGYLLKTDYDFSDDEHEVGEPPENNPYFNTVYRYYTPIQYTLRYYMNDNDDPTTVFNGVDQYTYAELTKITNPTRTGYTFMGWNVEVYDAVTQTWKLVSPLKSKENENFTQLGDKKATYDATERNDPNDEYASDALPDGKYEIRLTAQWKAIEYDIEYQWGDGVSNDLIQNLGNLPIEFTFGETCFIPTPTRAGYTFSGWTLTYKDGTVPPEAGLTAVEGGYMLNGALHPTKIVLKASWTVETYTVNLDGQGATNDFTASIPGIQYGTEWSIPDGFVIPDRTGFQFDGYWSAVEGGEKYINSDGTINITVWDLDDGENAGEITLYARWIRESYSVTVTVSGLPEGINPTIEILVGNTFYPNGAELPFETEYKVKITMPEGFKLVAWNGEAMDPTTMFESNTFTVGATMQAWGAESRPQAPTYGGDGAVTSIEKNDTQIRVEMNPDVADLYEFAILEKDNNPANVAPEDWKKITGDQNYYLFEGLNPGTTYYVFIRLQANGEVPSGIVYVHSATVTTHTEYVNNIKQELNNMLTANDGELANAVIENLGKEIDELVGDDDFFNKVEALIASAEARLALARLQDTKLAELDAYLNDCLASGSFSESNKMSLNDICAKAVTTITAATTKEVVEDAFNEAITGMKAVPYSYLYGADGAIKLESLLGLEQGAGIVLNSIEDIQALRRAVSDAIAAGKITADSFITIDEAKELFRALDTVSAYSFYLVNVQPAEGDTFIFRMRIPKALSGCTNLQVAYYNAVTGMVELLDTTVEGNELVFRAKQVADFVIMADPTVDLTYVIIVLGIIVLCQLLAILFVLAARNKAKNVVQHASVALPMAMTIYFLPVNAELIALGLGALALILQIVLMWLLISSGMIRVFKAKKPTPTRQKPAPAPRQQTLQSEPVAVAMEENRASEGSLVIEEEDQDDQDEEDVEHEQVLGEDAFDEALAEELAHEQAEEAVEEEIPEEVEEVYDDEEFIEHAPNPYYSLDDEEDAYAYHQEETERVSDVDTTDQETQETSYGTDSIDRVFGEAYVQDGYSGDEGGSQSYEDSYGESYEYGDEENASYAETEELDGEETSGQGSVDPTAYIVNDDEEFSTEEEMYRYDE